MAQIIRSLMHKAEKKILDDTNGPWPYLTNSVNLNKNLLFQVSFPQKTSGSVVPYNVVLQLLYSNFYFTGQITRVDKY